MNPEPKVSIIGLGLIGGSLALALRRTGAALRIEGCGRRPEALAYALKRGIADAVTHDPAEAARGASIVVVCTPVGTIPDMLQLIRPALSPDAIVTDAGSSKRGIVSRAETVFADARGPWFVGSHPMAGAEDSGVEAAREDLFENAFCVLTPGASAPAAAVDRVGAMWEAAGAKILRMSAEEHDSLVAAASHLPHLVAAALTKSVAEFSLNSAGVLPLLAGGFRDTTRIASGSPEVWRDICLSNGSAISEALDLFGDVFARMREVMRGGDPALVEKFFGAAKEFRDGIPRTGRGALAAAYEILVDATDRPGVIAGIATALGNAKINIKNLYVQHIRELQGGTILVTLESDEDRERAVEILTAEGFKAWKKA